MKKYLKFFVPPVLFLLLATKVQAVCPICIFGVGAGLGLSRWLKIDDLVTSLWLGAMLVALSLWTINWLSKKKIKFKGRKILIFAAYYGLTALSLWPFPQYTHIGYPNHALWGIDKIILGIVIGSIFFGLAVLAHDKLKQANNNKSYFPLQRVVIPIATLLILSIIFYFITK
jgi:hypothetical protein